MPSSSDMLFRLAFDAQVERLLGYARDELTIEASSTGMRMVDSVGCIVLVDAEIERIPE